MVQWAHVLSINRAQILDQLIPPNHFLVDMLPFLIIWKGILKDSKYLINVVIVFTYVD